MYAKSLPRVSWRFLQLLILTSVCFSVLFLFDPTYGRQISSRLPTAILIDISRLKLGSFAAWSGHGSAKHPIDQLIGVAETEFAALQDKVAHNVDQAAEQYRKRRKRHPPPGFERWYRFATEHNALVVEDFFDQIYDDLRPFWDARPHQLRWMAKGFLPKISVRNGSASATQNVHASRMKPWNELVEELKAYLPDIDIPVNLNDEPALVVPWDDINDAVSTRRQSLPPPTDVLDEFSGLQYVDKQNFKFTPEWLGARLSQAPNMMGPRPYWMLAKPACGPKSAAGAEDMFYDIWSRHPLPEHTPASILTNGFPNGTVDGYVRNWTVATDVCYHPHLQGLHGGFVRPNAISASVKLFPLFSGSKFAVNNDILMPSPEEWNASRTYSDDEAPGYAWIEKKDVLFWRGPATGGHNTKENWRRFHRHRFVSMLNASQVAVAEVMLRHVEDDAAGVGPAQNFRLSTSNEYNLYNQDSGNLAKWVERWADAQFTDLVLDSKPKRRRRRDSDDRYNAEFYSLGTPPSEREMDAYKYLPVLDGDGASDGFVSTLRSGSVPIKATLYRSWLDRRMVPWVHFVPMDNTFADLYGIMEYFVGIDTGEERVEMPDETASNFNKDGHDEAARRIARVGRDWARKVARREDMLLYVWRLLLEYGRVIDDRRERLGWAGDLLSHSLNHDLD